MHTFVNSSVVRALLRVYFVLILFLVAWLGNRCIHQRTKLKLLRGQQVSVTNMTGWLRGLTVIRITMQMRQLPGGFIGLFMIFTAGLALLADLAVSGLVKDMPIQSRCPFTTGLTIESFPSEYPSNIGWPAMMAINAQVVSSTNGGLFGIYHKTDNQSNFSAELVDIAGNWSCASYGQPVTYNIPEYSDGMITNDLMDNLDLLYPDIYSFQNWSVSESDTSTQTVIMSVSAKGSNTDPKYADVPSGLWKTRIAVDIDQTDNQKTFQVYDCEIVDQTFNHTVESVVANIDIGSNVLGNWLDLIQGKIWYNLDDIQPRGDPATTLSWMLNSMVMVAGSTNNMDHTSPFNQGCIRKITSVPPAVILCFSIALFLFLFFAFYFIWLSLRVHTESRHYDGNALVTTPDGTPVSSGEIKKHTPNGLLDWMQHAVHESGTSEKLPEYHHLRSWLFSSRRQTSNDGVRRLGVVSKHMSAMELNTSFATQCQQGEKNDKETQGLFATEHNSHPGAGRRQSSSGSSHFVSGKPLPSAEYTGAAAIATAEYQQPVGRKPVPSGECAGVASGTYQQIPKYDIEIGEREVNPTP